MFKAFKTDCTTFLTKYRIPFPEFLKALDGWIVISSLTEWFKTTAPPFSLARFVRADSRRRFTLPSTLETSTARNTVSLAALAGKAAMKESGVNQQLPNRGVAPEVRNLLRPYLDPEVVMTTAKHRWSRVKQRLRYAYHILSKLFESLVKSHFVLWAFALAKAA